MLPVIEKFDSTAYTRLIGLLGSMIPRGYTKRRPFATAPGSEPRKSEPSDTVIMERAKSYVG